MASVPNNYEINVVKDGRHFCRIQLTDSFKKEAIKKLETLRDVFGSEYELIMTYWECKGKQINI